jgi:flagellin-like hook-associated protein FlgL
VLNKINTADGNSGANAVTASLAANGNGFVLTDSSLGAGTFSVSTLNASPVASQLGIYTSSSTATITGTDVNPLEPKGLFSSLSLLRDGLISNDSAKIQRAAAMLDLDSSRIIRIRGTIGARAKDVEGRLDDVSNQQLQMKSSMADLADTNMTDAISKFQMMQTSYQASLQIAQAANSMSLMDFLK